MSSINQYQSTKVSNAIQSLQDFNEDEYLQGDNSNSFDLKNQVFELRSKCNQLQYQNKKIAMDYETVVKELKLKNAIIEKFQLQKGDKEDRSSNKIIKELRNACEQLNEENQALKKDLQMIYDKNRVTPDFNSLDFKRQSQDVLGELLQKEEVILKLEKQLKQEKQLKLNQFGQLKSKLLEKQQQNAKLREECHRLQTSKEQTVQQVSREAEDHHSKVLKYRDQTIEELKNQQINLTIKLEQYKKTIMALSSQNESNNIRVQNREKEEQLIKAQQNAQLVEQENCRLKNDKLRLEQENKYLQNQRKEQEQKKRIMQEELYKLQNQIAEVKATAFNQKIENKKIINSLRYDGEGDKIKIKELLQEKTQQNKKLRDSILSLNDQNEQLRQKESQFSYKYDTLQRQNKMLIDQIQKMKKNIDSNDKQQLKEMSMKCDELIHKLTQLQEQVKSKQQVIELLKFDKSEQVNKQKQLKNKLSESEELLEKNKTIISKLEDDIKIQKEQYRVLTLANQELQEKIQTMNSIMNDVERLNGQLKRQKDSLEERKREEERLRNDERSMRKREDENITERKYKNDYKNNYQGQLYHQISLKSTQTLRSGQNLNQITELQNLITNLSLQKEQLQVKLRQAENQIGRKGLDLNIKEEELTKLKMNVNKPQQMNFTPLVQASKRTQFNAICLQNKILQLQKEIASIRSIKQKQFQQFKKVYRKQMQKYVEGKYLEQMKKMKTYACELQKNNNLLNSKLGQQNYSRRDMMEKIQTLEQENYTVKYEYSQTLGELNQILQKYKQVQAKCQELEQKNRLNGQSDDQINSLKNRIQNLSKSNDQKHLMLKNANQQIKKLNSLLMSKESDLKKIQSQRPNLLSPNNSFIGSRHNTSYRNSLNYQYPQSQKSQQGEQIQRWIQKSPNYSRI